MSCRKGHEEEGKIKLIVLFPWCVQCPPMKRNIHIPTVSCVIILLLGSLSLAQDNAPPTTNPKLPTLWIVGDSTVHNSSGPMRGWGDVIAPLFDTSRINIVNKARGGRSSRTFITEGLWDDVMKNAKAGDFVIIQMGHNDGGPVSGDNRERGSLPGIGDESK